jgi:hypothetical protein
LLINYLFQTKEGNWTTAVNSAIQEKTSPNCHTFARAMVLGNAALMGGPQYAACEQ